MEPIASYREVRMEGKRTFDLHADRIFVRGYVVLSSSFEVSLTLRTLDPDWSRYRLRSSVFKSGLLLLLGFPVSLGLYEAHVPGSSVPFSFLMGWVGIFVLLVTRRKIEYAVFQNAAGVTVLMIARSGPDAAAFDDFVGKVAAQIPLARSAASEAHKGPPA